MTELEPSPGRDNNYRTVGTVPVGKLHRGAVGTVVAPTNDKWAVRPSIPSRVETVIHSQAHEPKAFGCSAYRFSDATVDFRPLSTEYQATSSSLREKHNKLSTSKTGTSAFASAKKAGFSEDAPIKSLPGPGAYDRDAPKARLTSCEFAFRKSEPRRAVSKLYKTNSPGPGQYQLPPKIAPSSAMSSKAPRMHCITPNAPGPGEFLPDSYINMTASKAKLSNSSSAVSYFNKSATSRGVVGSGNSLAAASGGGGGGGGSGASARNSPIRGVNAADTNNLPAPLMRVPDSELSPHVLKALSDTGPSSKSLRALPELMSSTEEARSKPSSVFRETNLDRFGNPIVRYATRTDDSKIGPGSYSSLRENKKKLISSSWALDTCDRDGLLNKNAGPGPCYYNPLKPARNSGQSFHVREDLPKSDLTAAKFRQAATMQRTRDSRSQWI